MTLDDTRKQVEEMIGKGNATPNGHIPFTPACQAGVGAVAT